MSTNAEQNWTEYIDTILPEIKPFLEKNHLVLADDQPHVKGERFLMQALTTAGGRKLILIGRETKKALPVVIKVATEPNGVNELNQERICRSSLNQLSFSDTTYIYPPELLFHSDDKFTVVVSEFIEQSSSFLERSLEEQLDFALKSFANQASTRATTNQDLASVADTFGVRSSQSYLDLHASFVESVAETCPENQSLIELLKKTHTHLETHQTTINDFGGYLTHTDFVPHNFRIRDGQLFYLDASSFRFANKHEGWARFLNFMTLYHHDLENLIITHVEENCSQAERESLQLMRIYRLGEILAYYSKTLHKSSGDLLLLNQQRIDFWQDVLVAEFNNSRVDRQIVTDYQTRRDELRSDEEKQRQVGLH